MSNSAWLKKPVAEQIQEFVADASLAIDIGDLMYLDTDDAKPASSQADQLTEEANQTVFARNFVGVANSARRSTDATAGVVRVQTDGLYEFTCTSSTFEIGDLVGADEQGSGTALEDQSVKKVTQSMAAIGVVTQRYSSATTKVWCRLLSRKSGDLANRVPDAFTATPAADNGAGSTIPAGATMINVTTVTNDANDWITLPNIKAVPVGHTITICCNAGGNFELRTPASSNEKINNVDSDGSQEALCTDTHVIRVIKMSDSAGWMAHSFTRLGAVVTAVVPD